MRAAVSSPVQMNADLSTTCLYGHIPSVISATPACNLDQAAAAAAEAEAVRHVVAAAPPGTLNWDVNKDRSLWNYVTIAGAGDEFFVDFGLSFRFRFRVDLADLAGIFGTELVSLKVLRQDKL